jgi:hypothetical protein
MKGGLFGFGESNSTGPSWWDRLTGKKPTNTYMPQIQPTETNYASQPGVAYGGKHKSKRRYMSGGFTSNAPQMNVAGYAAPISGIPNAQPQAWVGGPEYKGGKRTRRRNKRHNKSYRKH